ncbi:MAG: response regulator [Gammaproteobacteria bacterium]|nr:response regulator [Gammaproteobacteria bacterium]
MEKGNQLLIVSDQKDDLDTIVRQVASSFTQYHVAADDAKGIQLFDKFLPEIILVCLQDIEHSQRFYLGLYRASEKIKHSPHQSILLCKTTESNAAYEICVRGVFDDYVVFNSPYDVHRLKLSTQQAIEKINLRLQLAEFKSSAASTRQYDGLQKLSMDDAIQTYADLETALGAQLDRFLNRMASGDLQSSASQLDPGQLKQQFTRFKQETISAELKKSLARFTPERAGTSVTETSNATAEKSLTGSASDRLHAEADRYILVVDDDEMYLTILQSILQSAGYQVIQAMSGRQALEQMNRRKPDLVLLDLNMPEMDGIEVMKIARSHEYLKGVPIIMLTGNSQKTTVLEAIQGGARDYIVKPAESRLLLEKVAAMLERKSIR